MLFRVKHSAEFIPFKTALQSGERLMCKCCYAAEAVAAPTASEMADGGSTQQLGQSPQPPASPALTTTSAARELPGAATLTPTRAQSDIQVDITASRRLLVLSAGLLEHQPGTRPVQMVLQMRLA